MTDLLEFQEEFKACLLDNDSAIAKKIRGSAEEKKQRLHVYISAYHNHCMATLKLDYPVLLALLGKLEFEKLAKPYIQQVRAEDFAIHQISKEFSSFLLPIDQRYADLAKVEWAVDEILDEKDFTCLSMKRLIAYAQFGFGHCVFKFIPALRLLEVNSNAFEVWATFQSKEVVSELKVMDLKTGLIWRDGLVAAWKYIDDPEKYMIEDILAGKVFEDICDGLCQYKPEREVPEYAIKKLQEWRENGLLAQ